MKDKLKHSINSYMDKHKHEPMGKHEIREAKAKQKALSKMKK